MILLWTNLIKTLDNNDTGYLIQVDMHFPIELHDKIKLYTLASETLTPELEWLSEVQKEI